jgi:hypothetical protein
VKWNKRLKSVLTETAKSGFSEESLETPLTITDKTRLSLVSSAFVSDEFRHFPENPQTAENQTPLVSSAFVSVHSRDSLKTNDDLAQFEADTFHEVVNRFIEKGITFDVSADEFQTIDPAQILKTSDKEFLKLNSAAILCQLHQSLLMKHLFSHSPERFEDFAFEIRERECLNSPLTITDKTRYEIYFEAVKSTTRKWFVDLLEKRHSRARLDK